ncbi:hypothetical protein AB1Y20_010840 [Prymnesium parvum]|uniref:Peroxiredoxin-like 2 activated in M-CSF stimulated monocytes n=1 Tax=Prymnesium parvum TaxID=97485 RepID=A0AB34ISF7_PRYPA
MARLVALAGAAAAAPFSGLGAALLTPLTAGSALPVYGVVKEAEAEAEDIPAAKLLGVHEFERDFFCGPLFQDKERVFYKALGDQSILSFSSLAAALLHPIQTWQQYKSLGVRLKEKKVEGNMRGDGLTKGGVLVISADGEVLHAFYERMGEGVPEDECAKIVAAVKQLTST